MDSLNSITHQIIKGEIVLAILIPKQENAFLFRKNKSIRFLQFPLHGYGYCS